MTEKRCATGEGWIVAPCRRDGSPPSPMKGIGSSSSTHVFWSRQDAEVALAEAVLAEGCSPTGVYAVFRVEVIVSSEGRVVS